MCAGQGVPGQSESGNLGLWVSTSFLQVRSGARKRCALRGMHGRASSWGQFLGSLTLSSWFLGVHGSWVCLVLSWVLSSFLGSWCAVGRQGKDVRGNATVWAACHPLYKGHATAELRAIAMSLVGISEM